MQSFLIADCFVGKDVLTSTMSVKLNVLNISVIGLCAAILTIMAAYVFVENFLG